MVIRGKTVLVAQETRHRIQQFDHSPFIPELQQTPEPNAHTSAIGHSCLSPDGTKIFTNLSG